MDPKLCFVFALVVVLACGSPEAERESPDPANDGNATAAAQLPSDRPTAAQRTTPADVLPADTPGCRHGICRPGLECA